MRFVKWSVLGVLLACGTASTCCAAGLYIYEELVNGFPGPPLPKFSRFVGGNAFIFKDYDLSGVGRTVGPGPVVGSDAIKDHGTMVSGSFALSAHHDELLVHLGVGINVNVITNSIGRHPEGPSLSRYPNGELIRFYHHGTTTSDLNDPQKYTERRVTHTWYVGNLPDGSPRLYGDLEACELDTPVSADVAVYPVLFLPSFSDYNGHDLLYVGKSSGLHQDPDQLGLRAARNSINTHAASGNGADDRCIDMDIFGSSRPEYGRGISGDSGSPSLMIDNNIAWGPVLAGCHKTRSSDSAVTVPEMRDALRNELLARQQNVPVHEREVPTFFTGLVGDYDGSHMLDAPDIDIIVREARYTAMYGSRGWNWYLDYNQDGQVTDLDVDLQLAIMTGLLGIDPIYRGDANLDGVVGVDDYDIYLNNIWQNDKGWADGDFNGDGSVDGSDFNWIILNWNE